MRAEASISWAGVSKAKPQRMAWPAIGAHARRSTAAQGGWQAAAARHTGRAGHLVWSYTYQIELRGGDDASALGGGGPGAGGGGESGRRCASGRGGASGSGGASGRCELVRRRRWHGRARRRRETAMRACRGGASHRGGAMRRRREARSRVASRRGGARRGRARRGEVAATTTEEEWGDAAIWAKMANLEGDRDYIEPPPFVTGPIPNRENGPS
jgi:hypothetical protein